MATITNLQGSTQIGNSDEIINQNFQNINNAMVEKTGDQSIAGIKTFTDRNIIQDVTNNTENPYMRVTANKRITKNLNNAGGVNFALYTDADGSLIGNRKLSFRGYLKKRLDGAIATYNELFSIEYDTYNGDTTYTTRTNINTDSLYVKGQNWTGVWASYTPTVSGDSGSVGSYGRQSGCYYVLGKNVFFEVDIIVNNKGSLSGAVKHSLPTASINSIGEMIQTGGVYTPGGIVNKGLPVVYNGTIGHFLVGVDTGSLQRSSYTNGDVIRVQGRYTTA